MSDNKGMSRLSDMMNRSNPNSLNSDAEKTPSLASTLDFTKSQAQRDEEAMPERKMVYLHQLMDFPNHPFHVRDDEDMQRLKESVIKFGIRTPIEVIPTGETNDKGEETYYIVAGHRRRHVAQQLFPEDQRVEVRIQNMNMDEATIAMTESNLLTRENILPCERGNAFRMEMEARERITGRAGNNRVVASSKSRDEIGEKNGLKGRQVQNYIRLSYLIPELQEIVDNGDIGINTGVELSYLSPKEQHQLYEELDLTDFEHYPNLAQAKQMRKLSKEGKLDMDALVDIIEVPKPNQYEHIRYVPKKEDLRSKIPAHLKPEFWKDKDYEAFIEQAIAFYAKSLEEQHQQEQSQQNTSPIPRKAWERSI